MKRKEWENRAKLIASLGYNCVDVYFPWNYHETNPGKFDFSGERDVDEFLRICEENHLYVMARPGPYICSEWDGGGLPAWVLCNTDIRQNDSEYLREVKRWYDQILPILASHQLCEQKDGCIILMQLENELDFFDCRDVDGYLGRLREMALAHNVTVPLIACSGQGDIKRSGGLAEGILPAYNFYPEATDPAFDYNLALYAKYLRKNHAAFLVSETSKSHSILKRELLAGAKLLGAYNQVGGTNFGYYQSVNNWGTPFSIISTLYELDGMVDNLGHCTREADEALLFSEMLRVYGAPLAEGACHNMAPPFPCGDETVGYANALSLAGNLGTLLCVRSVREEPAVFQSEFRGSPFELSFEAGEAFALPYQVKADDYSILFSNNEILSFQPLVLIARSKPFLLLEKDGKQIVVTDSGTYDGMEVAFLSKEEALSQIKAKRNLELTYARELYPKRVEGCQAGRFENPNKFIPASSSVFSENQIWYGEAEYRIHVPSEACCDLLLQGVADFLTVWNNGKTVYSGLCTYGDVLVTDAGEVRAFVEQWGHSNFDDARRKSMRIASDRGIERIYRILSKQELNKWSFTEMDRFSTDVKFETSDTDPHISINHWNSTREPLFAAYYTEIDPDIQPGEEILLVLEGLEAECNLFVNGSFAARFSESQTSVNITKLLRSGEKNQIGLCVRKKNWAVKTGRLYLLTAAPCEFELRKVDHLDVCGAPMEPAKLPLRLEKGKMYAVCLEIPAMGDTYAVTGGSGYRATIIQDREVIARIVAEDDRIVQAGTRNSSQFLVPSGHGPNRRLYCFLEAMKDGSFDFAVCEDNDENSKD